jgi:hypothetical protein
MFPSEKEFRYQVSNWEKEVLLNGKSTHSGVKCRLSKREIITRALASVL